MIVKYFELKKQNLKEKNFFLLYGNNQGLINETIQDTLKPKLSKNILATIRIKFLINLTPVLLTLPV